MTQLEQAFALAATSVEDSIRAVQALIPAYQVPVPVPVPQPSGGNGYPSMTIDPRTYGAKGDGSVDDTGAIQKALDNASMGITGPSMVLLARGDYLCNGPTLKFNNDGIILQGFGMDGQGPYDPNASRLIAGPNHVNGPMILIDANDGGKQWYRGTCLRGISLDVTRCPYFTKGQDPAKGDPTPPPVLKLRGLSNCPEFRDILVWGHTGSAIDIGCNTVAGAVSENLRFLNFWAYGGHTADGGIGKEVPKAPGILNTGADNIQFYGGLMAYDNANGTLPVTNSPADIAAIQVMPGAIGGGYGGINVTNNGFIVEGMAITNYVVSCRVSPLLFNGTWYGSQHIKFTNMVIENFNRAFVVNEEAESNNLGYWRSQVFVSKCIIGGGNAWYGPNPHQFLGDHMNGGIIDLDFLGFPGDLSLGPETNGVRYSIGSNPNGPGVFYDAKDQGTNSGQFCRNGVPGSVLNGSLAVMGNTPASQAVRGTGNTGIQSWGDTAQLWGSSRTLGSSSQSDPGNFGEMVMYQDPADGKFYIAGCIKGGNPGSAVWHRALLQPWGTKS